MKTYTFESLFKSHTLCGKPNLQFYNYSFETTDEETAARVRRNCGTEIWETTGGGATPPDILGAPVRKRGRPPKVQVLEGARLSQTEGEHAK